LAFFLPKVSGIPSHCEHIVRNCERSLHKGPQNSEQNIYDIVLDMLSGYFLTYYCFFILIRFDDYGFTFPNLIPNYQKNTTDPVRAGNNFFYFIFSKYDIRNDHRFGICPCLQFSLTQGNPIDRPPKGHFFWTWQSRRPRPRVVARIGFLQVIRPMCLRDLCYVE